MNRPTHLFPVPSQDELIELGLRLEICRHMAALVVSGEHVYDIATDTVIARENASADDISAAVEALAEFMFDRSLGDAS